MAAIGTFFSALFKAISGIFGWLQQNQLLKAGEAVAVAKQLEKNNHDIEVALHAREDARARNSSVPVSDSLPDDGFLRD